MINTFQLLYQERKSTCNIQTEEEVRTFIDAELLDEYTHPRARLSIEKKYKLAIDRITKSRLSENQQQKMVELYNEEYRKLSTEDNI